ncbi:MAG: helix-turn-helix transcriptional regulator [Lachnospiraceae bacterium]|nr:helix-turn-helix transcriptional regulator [Lachnospiraceae bacterium]
MARTFEEYFEHTNADYPVGVYYVDLKRMFMERVRTQWHEAMEIDLLRSGRAVFSIGDEEFTAETGTAVWINQNRLHAIRPADGEDCQILSILFSPLWLFEKPESFLAVKYCQPLTSEDSMPYMVLDRSEAYGRRALECIDAILTANLDKAYGYELQSKSMFCGLWLQLLEKGAHPGGVSVHSLTDEQRVKDAMTYIHSNYSKALTLEDIAASINVSKSECCRAFKRSTGGSPFEYLLTQRILEAARRMQRGDRSAATIQKLAAAAGFGNPSYFNRVFRKYTGYTPTQYREIIKKSHRDALSPYGISLARL